jgi:hypothetical protein
MVSTLSIQRSIHSTPQPLSLTDQTDQQWTLVLPSAPLSSFLPPLLPLNPHVTLLDPTVDQTKGERSVTERKRTQWEQGRVKTNEPAPSLIPPPSCPTSCPTSTPLLCPASSSPPLHLHVTWVDRVTPHSLIPRHRLWLPLPSSPPVPLHQLPT